MLSTSAMVLEIATKARRCEEDRVSTGGWTGLYGLVADVRDLCTNPCTIPLC